MTHSYTEKKSKNKKEQLQVNTEFDTTQVYKNSRDNLYNSILPAQKIKSNPSFSLDKMSTRTIQIAKTRLIPQSTKKQLFKLPPIKNNIPNPENLEKSINNNKDNKNNQVQSKIHYQSNLYRCLKKHQTSYLMNLYRQHFYQCIQVLRFGKSIKVPTPRKHIKLYQKNSNMKTIFLDMDQTLIHCDQTSNNYSVKLNFPLQRGGFLAAGVRIRPFCKEFLQKLSEFAQIIIFTASSSSYADVVLDHLDPEKKYISHRLYRQHCTLQKGYYLKDLRIANRKLQNSVLVDNSPYCHILQPQNAIPIVPFYHFAKDDELQILLEFLKIIVDSEDTRTVIANTYFWDKYIKQPGQPRKIFFKYFKNSKEL